jgi:hypothetical protein
MLVCIFWDIFIARRNEKQSKVAALYIEMQQMKAREQHQLQQMHYCNRDISNSSKEKRCNSVFSLSKV